MNAQDIYIFVGPPGSGKGSVSSLCVQELGWIQLSTGNLCRKHIAEGTALGQEIETAIKMGKLISDDLMTRMVQEWLQERLLENRAIIFDGYPRTLAQVRAFYEIVRTMPQVRLTVVCFDVPDEKVVLRISGRLVCQNKDCQAVYSNLDGLKPQQALTCDKCGADLGRRKDDDPETIRARLQVYHQHEQELVNFYLNSGYSVLNLDADRPLPEVFRHFKSMVGLEKA